MILLHIEHSVANYDAWKAAFDSDPVGREKLGVRCYHILRAADNADLVAIDLEFGSRDEAESLLAAMQQVWRRVGGSLIQQPQWQIFEVAESRKY